MNTVRYTIKHTLNEPIEHSQIVGASAHGSPLVINLIGNPTKMHSTLTEFHATTKHIDVQHHFIQECIEKGSIKLEYYPTKNMVADALTKALPRERHKELMARMGLENIEHFKSGGVGILGVSNAKDSNPE